MMVGKKEEVVISGIGGWFPECDNLDEFKDLLFEKKNGITIDSRRWNKNELDGLNGTGKLKCINTFDSTFFNVNMKLGNAMAPLTKIVVERSIEAIIDAGMCPMDLNGTNTAVFTGSAVSETDSSFSNISKNSSMTLLGNNRGMQANRVSYILNLTGPSFAMDGGWTCGATGLQDAKEMIEKGLIKAAIVGVTNLTLRPEIQLQFQGMNRLNQCDQTKPFSSEADGYNRSEGCIVMFLQKKSEAKRSYGTLLNIKTWQFGDHHNHITSNEGEHFKSLLNDCYNEVKIDPSSIEFVEANGSGIKREDEMELNVMEEIFCNKNRTTPLKVGSVKSNVGHSEPCALFMSIVKAIIAFESGYIPPNINYTEPNENIRALKTGKIQVVTEKTPFKGDVIGITGFGLVNSFSHVILKRNPKEKIDTKNIDNDDNIPRLVLVSARNEENARETMKIIKSHEQDLEYISLVNDVFSRHINAHNFRTFSILPVMDKNRIEEVWNITTKKRPIWFIFSGMGSQWQGMGTHLLKIPIFADSINKIDAILKPLGVDIINILTNLDPKTFDNILNSFVGIAAMQIALFDLLKALDIEPDGYIGHSLGEIGCAYADGCFTAEETILSAYARGRVSIETELIEGMMAAIGLGYEQVKNRLPHDIDVACHNSATSCTISGPVDSINAFVAELKSEGIFAKAVNVANIAYHSRYIQSAGPSLLKYLTEIQKQPKMRSSKWISSSIHESKWDSELAQYSSAEYHTNNLLSSVLFEDALKHIPSDAVVIEIAPHGLLQSILKSSLPNTVKNISLTKRVYGDSVRFLLSAIGNMYTNDLNPKIQALYSPITYPVSRGTPSIHNLPFWEHSTFFNIDNIKNYSLNELFTSISLENCINSFDYKIHGWRVLPVSFILCEVWKLYVDINEKEQFTNAIQFQNVQCDNNVESFYIESTEIDLMIQRGTGYFEFIYNHKIVISGNIKFYEENILEVKTETTNLKETDDDFQGCIPRDEIYDTFENDGHKLGNNFKIISKFEIYKKRIQGIVKWKNDWIYFLDALLKFSLVENLGLRTLETPISIGDIIISPANFKNIVDTDIQVNYNLLTKEIKCDGVHILRIKNAPFVLSKIESKNIELEEKSFVSFKQLRCKDIDEFIDNCMDIIMEQDDLNLDTVSRKFVLCNPYHYNDNTVKTCIVAVKQILENKSINNKTLNWDDVGHVSKNDELERYITVTHADYLKDTTKTLINKKWSYIITCSKKEIRDVNHKEWKIITQQHFDDGYYIYLLKRVIPPKKNSIFIKSSCVDTSKEIWTSIENSKLSNETIYIVLNKVPSEGFTKYVSNTIQKYKSQNLRFLFILDKNAPDLEKQKSFYVDQLSKGLTINIYKNGEWGTYKRMFVQDIKKNTKMTENIINPVLTFNKQNKIAIKYIGMNFKDLVFENTTKNEFGPIEYSGIIYNDKKIMGFASLEKISDERDIDAMFSWPVPVTWSFEDAATVPLTYALAYYTLKVLSNLTTDKSMLITSGLHPIGQAAISIALAEKCNIYVLVESTDEANILSSTFSTLPRSNIIIDTNNKFDIKIKMITKSRGIDIIINLLAGESFHTSLRLLAPQALFFHFTKSNMRNQESIGLNVFVLYTSLIVITSDMLLNETESNKKIVNEALKKGLKEGTVRPFKRNVIAMPFENNKIFTSLRTATKYEKVLLNLNNNINKIKSLKYDGCVKFECHPNHTYVIVGNKSDWLDLAYWLADRGAQKIILLIKICLMSTITCRRINKLISQKVAISIESDAILSKRKYVVDWLKITSSSHDLGSLFVINQFDSDKINNLRFAFEECSSKTKSTSFICISSKAEHICSELKSIGFNAINISWNGSSQKSENLQNLLISLDTLIINSNSMASSSFICSEKVSDTSKNTRKLTQYYLSYFPETVDELHYLSEKLMRETSFVEVETNSPRYSELKGVLPVFIIPGFKPNVIEMFYERLCYPVFEARFSEDIGSIDDLSKVLVNKIKSITGKNSVSLIGECWGGIVALKMAQMLEAEGIMVTLSLLEGDPQMLFNCAQYFLTNDNIEKLLYSMYSTNVSNQNTEQCGVDKIQPLIVSSLEKKKEKITLRALKSIRSRLQALVETRPLSNKLLTKVLFFRNVKQFESNLPNFRDYCFNQPSIRTIDVKEYKQMLENKEMNRLIYSNIAILQPFVGEFSLNDKYANFFYSK